MRLSFQYRTPTKAVAREQGEGAFNSRWAGDAPNECHKRVSRLPPARQRPRGRTWTFLNHCFLVHSLEFLTSAEQDLISLEFMVGACAHSLSYPLSCHCQSFSINSGAALQSRRAQCSTRQCYRRPASQAAAASSSSTRSPPPPQPAHPPPFPPQTKASHSPSSAP